MKFLPWRLVPVADSALRIFFFLINIFDIGGMAFVNLFNQNRQYDKVGQIKKGGQL